MISEKGYVDVFSLGLHGVRKKSHLINGEVACWMSSRSRVMHWK
jgi:hypothetical protein